MLMDVDGCSWMFFIGILMDFDGCPLIFVGIIYWI
jgi:hypothetical protein